MTRRRGRPGPDPIEILDAWERAIVAWKVELRAAGRPSTSLRVLIRYVRGISYAVASPELVTRADLLAFLSREDWSPETRKSARTSLRAFFGWAHAEGLIPSNPAERLPEVRVPHAEPRPADDAAIEAALAAASDRVRLMLLLGAVAGLRRSEIAQVHTGDLRGDALLVHGKGGKERTVDLPPALAGLLRSLPAGWAFPGPAGHMSPEHVGKLVTRSLPRGTTPHMLRHAAASALHEDGVSLLELRAFLGHTSVATTQRYVRVRSTRTTEAMARRAAALAGAR